ncbi:hypothetical protein [Nocardia rhamnosiphila]|uniref:MFS transporter n=1 Tax=Nocardia rhamnosiphila TaxID=426716 RepID=A0ABV2WMT7_9NOCA
MASASSIDAMIRYRWSGPVTNSLRSFQFSANRAISSPDCASCGYRSARALPTGTNGSACEHSFSDAQRGRIIAVFAIGASVTVGLAAPLGNFVLHRPLVYWLGTGLVLGAVALLLVPVQRRATAVSADEQ